MAEECDDDMKDLLAVGGTADVGVSVEGIGWVYDEGGGSSCGNTHSNPHNCPGSIDNNGKVPIGLRSNDCVTSFHSSNSNSTCTVHCPCTTM